MRRCPLPLLAWTLLLAGCAALPGQERQADVTYFLDPNPTAIGRFPETFRCLTLTVMPLRSAPGYATARMVYVREPHRLDYFARHRWVDSPARMLAPLVIEALDRSGLFGGTVMAPSPVEAELRLDAGVAALRQLFRGEGHSEVELRLDVTLADTRTGRLLGTARLATIEPATPTPRGAAEAANAATAKVLAQLVQFLAKSLEASGQTCSPP